MFQDNTGRGQQIGVLVNSFWFASGIAGLHPSFLNLQFCVTFATFSHLKTYYSLDQIVTYNLKEIKISSSDTKRAEQSRVRIKLSVISSGKAVRFMQMVVKQNCAGLLVFFPLFALKCYELSIT